MREIKFKGWCEMCNKFILLHTENMRHSDHGLEAWCDHHTCYTKVSLIQFTGLKDVNSVEIYKGDIVCHQPEKRRWVVKWHDEQAEYYLDDTRKDDPFVMGVYAVNCMKIIGNIYENPELIKVDING